MTQDTVRSFIFYLCNGHRMRPPGNASCVGATLPAVRSNFARLGLLDEQVVFLRGFFSDTLPGAPFERLALLRLDGDLYPSTRDALVHCYPKLTVGGFSAGLKWRQTTALLHYHTTTLSHYYTHPSTVCQLV